QPVVEAVADTAGHRREPGELRGPHVSRGEIRTGEAPVEIGGRYRSLDTEHQPVVLKVVAELPAADDSAPAVARHRIQRRKKRGPTQISPPDAIGAVADLATQIEAGPARRHIRRRGTLHVGHIGCCSKFNRRNAYARNDGERSTDAEKHMASPWSPPTREFSGNLPATWAKARLRCVSFSTRLIKFVALRSDGAPVRSSASPVRMGRSGDGANRRCQRRGHSVVRAPCVT